MRKMKQLQQKIVNVMWALALGVTPVPAGTPSNDVVSDITKIKEAAFEAMAEVGVCFVAFGIVKAVRANSKGMDDGVDKGIGWAIAGIVMIGIGGVMAWLGY